MWFGGLSTLTFSYCPLVWMFCHSRRLNRRINHIHERGLRIVYEDYASSFPQLLKINGSVCIHHKNIHLVAILMFKVKNALCPEIMRDIFQLNTNPNPRTTFVIPKVNGEYMGKLSLRYFGPVVWETMLPEKYKSITELEKFKEESVFKNNVSLFFSPKNAVLVKTLIFWAQYVVPS